MLLANFGIFCRVLKRRAAGQRVLPDGKGGKKLYDCKADYELIVGSVSRAIASWTEIGFITRAQERKVSQMEGAAPALRMTSSFVSAHRRDRVRRSARRCLIRRKPDQEQPHFQRTGDWQLR